jgi:hypothetical protein
MAKFRKKPVVIEAFMLGIDVPPKWFEDQAGKTWSYVIGINQTEGDGMPEDVLINTLEGQMRATHGTYIIKGIKGEFYPCAPDIFEASYEEALE